MDRPGVSGPPDIPMREHRLVNAKLALAMIRGWDRAYVPGTDVATFALGLAIFISTVENRPMSANKLALYLGIPRETVRRRLALMIEAGAVELVNRQARIPISKLLSAEVTAVARELAILLDDSCRSLPKLPR